MIKPEVTLTEREQFYRVERFRAALAEMPEGMRRAFENARHQLAFEIITHDSMVKTIERANMNADAVLADFVWKGYFKNMEVVNDR